MQDTALKWAWRRFVISAVLTVLLLYISLAPLLGWLPGGGLPAAVHPVGGPIYFALAQLVLFAAIAGLSARVLVEGARKIIARRPGWYSLLTVGVAAAALYSLVSVIWVLIGDSGAAYHLYFNGAGAALVLILLGESLEARMEQKSGLAIAKLAGAEQTFTVLRDGRERQMYALELQAKDSVIVWSGERIPADAVVLEGECAVDESALTGASLPVDKKPGDAVYAPSLCINTRLVIRVDKVGEDTKLAEYIRLADQAKAAPAAPGNGTQTDKEDKLQGESVWIGIADALSFWFVLIFAAASVVAGIAAIIITRGNFAFGLRVLALVLISALPCAMGIAAPAAILTGMGRGGEKGFIIRNAAVPETARRVDVVALDKTGTITEGTPVVTDVVPIPGGDPAALLALAASALRSSGHPFARAVVGRARQKKLVPKEAERHVIHPGGGAEANIGSRLYHAGTRSLLAEKKIIIPQQLDLEAYRLENEGKMPLFLAEDGKPLGVLAIADAIKASSAQAVKKLITMGLDVVMLTGDDSKVAATVAAKVGISEVMAELTPEQKAEYVKRLQAQGKVVAMIGNAANDAPAIAQADIGVAIDASAPATHYAEIAITSPDPLTLPAALSFARATIRNIKQNLWIAFAFGVICAAFASGLASLTGGPLLSPALLVAGILLCAGGVLVNSVRLAVR